MALLASDKFKPTIFVGLGGNGGKIVNMLAHKLKRHAAWNRIENLVHFLAIDTNKDDLDKFRDIQPDSRFLVSSFDARAYVERKRGLRELAEDPLVTQWVPANYAFRSTQGAGAGQIRLESRLRLYYNLEEDRAGIRKKVGQMLQQSTSREDPWRDNEDKVVRVVLFCSVAGGTGSGGFLPMAYLLRDMVLDAGWGRPNVTAFLTLPTAFLDKVKPQLHADIMANGYAALKELEFLTRQLDYGGGVEKLEFHYDPGTLDEDHRFARERPFTLAYLIDRPSQVSIERYEAAVADAAFLQMFSPLLGAQAGEYDNYEKRQKQLALGHFTVHFGALGTALLQLPRNDILRYASLRYTARAFRDFLSFGASASGINYADPAFQKLDQREKNRRVDEAFTRYVEERATEEESRNEKGVFFGVKAQLGEGLPLHTLFQQKLDGILTELTNLTAGIESADVVSINPGNPSLRRPESTLRKQYAEVSAKAQGEFLEGLLSQIKSGRFFREFFGHGVNPLAQRLFLIRLLQEDFIAPSDESKEMLRAQGVDFNPSDPNLQKQLSQHEKALNVSSQQSMLGKLVDRDNAKFNAAKRVAKGFLDKIVREAQDDILRRFWRQLESALRGKAEELAGRFRELARLSDEATRQLEMDAERFRRDPGASPESDVAQYYLDAEVLKDDRKNDRLWNVLYAHKLEAASWKSLDIFKAVTSAFREERDVDGVLRVPDAAEISARIRTELMASSRATFSRTLEEAKLDLASGLELEQRYIAVLASAQDLSALQQGGKLDEAVKAVPEKTVTLGLLDRLRRLNDQCMLLAHIDPTKKDDPSVTPAEVFLIGVADKFNTDEETSIGRLLRQVVNKQANFVIGWDDEDSMVLYRATLGIPVYFFRNVQFELYNNYKRVRDDKNRSYPLHIEAAWENDGLPDLDPLEQKRADDRRKQEAEAAAKRGAEQQGMRDFALASVFGSVVKEDGGYVWSSPGAKGPLGTDRASAFKAFQGLDTTFRSDLLDTPLSTWSQAKSDRATRERVVGEVRVHEQRLKEIFAKAMAEQRDVERRHVSLEREVVTTLLKELGG